MYFITYTFTLIIFEQSTELIILDYSNFYFYEKSIIIKLITFTIKVYLL